MWGPIKPVPPMKRMRSEARVWGVAPNRSEGPIAAAAPANPIVLITSRRVIVIVHVLPGEIKP